MKANYLIIGDGRVARHFARYFELLSLSFTQWSRKQDTGNLRALVESASHVLLLISDGAIATFHDEHPYLSSDGRVCVHFSGSLVFDGIRGAHPLMTFSHELYDLETYRRVPFVLERGHGSLDEILPGLRNECFALEPGKKGLYHALCVMSGNFTIMLWEKVFADFEEKLGLPRAALVPYLERVAQNLAASKAGSSVLTGPLARGDRAVITKHLTELRSDPYEGVYRSFVTAYEQSKDKTPEVNQPDAKSPEVPR